MPLSELVSDKDGGTFASRNCQMSRHESCQRQALESILVATYDVHFRVDARLRFLSESVKLRYFFSIPNRQKLIGRPLEAYIPVESDKARLKSLVYKDFEAKTSDGSLHAPPVLRLSMLIENSQVDVNVIIVPWRSSEYPHVDPSTMEFLVCVNRVPYVENGKLLNLPKSSFVDTDRIHPSRSPLNTLREGRYKTDSLNNTRFGEILGGVHQSSVDISDIHRTTRAPRHLLLIQSLTRDMCFSVCSAREKLEKGRGDPIWFDPLLIVHDKTVLQDELVRALPAGSQRAFTSALASGDCKSASLILGQSFEGNLDIFNHQTLGATVRSSQLISATFRLFLAIATSTSNSSVAMCTLHGLAQWAFRIHTKYTLTKGVLINTHLSLALATVALRYPDKFATSVGQAWVTETFASCFSCHKAFTSEIDETAPLLYWACLLWAGILRSSGKSSAAITVLANLKKDISGYLGRHPMCTSVSDLLYICRNNMNFLSQG